MPDSSEYTILTGALMSVRNDIILPLQPCLSCAILLVKTTVCITILTMCSIVVEMFECCSEPTDGAEVVARMLEHFARHQGPYASLLKHSLSNGNMPSALDRGRSVTRAGAGRLRDAIVFGYMMQRHKARGKV